jgi:hypothetical protein
MSSGISPKLLRGGLLSIDPGSGTVKRVVALQYNPDSISRSMQILGTGDNGERSEVLRLKGPAVETIKLEAEIDATDQLEHPGENAGAARFGIAPQLAVLEGMINPAAADLVAADALAKLGTIEIAPAQAPLTVFVWSAQRVLPVRLTEFSVTEEAFDPRLNPIRAKVSLGMRVLSVNDVGFSHKAGTLFLAYLQNREKLAGNSLGAKYDVLGLGGKP